MWPFGSDLETRKLEPTLPPSGSARRSGHNPLHKQSTPAILASVSFHPKWRMPVLRRSQLVCQFRQFLKRTHMKACIRHSVWLFVLLTGCSKNDPRLLGRWKSDASLSMQWNQLHATYTGESLNVITQRFGQRTLEFRTNRKFIIESSSFKMPFQTNGCCIIRSTNKYYTTMMDGPLVVETVDGRDHSFDVIHFESPDVFWIDDNREGPSPREYFKRERSGAPINE